MRKLNSVIFFIILTFVLKLKATNSFEFRHKNDSSKKVNKVPIEYPFDFVAHIKSEKPEVKNTIRRNRCSLFIVYLPGDLDLSMNFVLHLFHELVSTILFSMLKIEINIKMSRIIDVFIHLRSREISSDSIIQLIDQRENFNSFNGFSLSKEKISEIFN